MYSHFAGKRGSPAQLIHWSPELRGQFKTCVRRNCGLEGVRVTNLRAAKHRFESLQKPMGRACWLMRGFLRFIIMLAVQLNHEASRHALVFLAWITFRKYILAGMMADLSDEVSLLTRFGDVEDIPTEEMTHKLSLFLSRLNWLVGTQLGILQQGYTKYVIDTLTQHPVVWVVGNKAAQLGSAAGPLQADLDWCVDIIRGCARLMIAEVKCEFPFFEVAQALQHDLVC